MTAIGSRAMFRRLMSIAVICLVHGSQVEEAVELLDCTAADASCVPTDASSLLQYVTISQNIMQNPVAPVASEQLGNVAGNISGAFRGKNYLAQLATVLKAGQPGMLGMPPVNCKKTPALCSKLLNCNKKPITMPEMMGLMRDLAPNGRANLRLWCMGADDGEEAVALSKKVGHCLVNKDLETAAPALYESELDTDAADSQAYYCFRAGLCDDSEITFQTTLAQGEKICSKRYPKWTSFGLLDLSNVKDDDEEQALLFSAMMACVQGVYQCDVAYCKATYCQSKAYQQLYAATSQAL